MSLEIAFKEKSPGVFIVSPIGYLDSETHGQLENKIKFLLESSPKMIIYDFEKLDYISSAGIRVMFVTEKEMKNCGGNVTYINFQPQIKKVFDIINALPSMRVFSNVRELDEYLDKMQKDVTDM